MYIYPLIQQSYFWKSIQSYTGERTQITMNLLMEVHNTTFETVLTKLNFNLIMPLDLTTNLQKVQKKEEYVKHMWMQSAKLRPEILLNNPQNTHTHTHTHTTWSLKET